jgi:hypothetical protein
MGSPSGQSTVNGNAGAAASADLNAATVIAGTTGVGAAQPQTPPVVAPADSISWFINSRLPADR